MEDMKKVNKKQLFPDTSNTIFGEESNEIIVAGSTQTKGVFFWCGMWLSYGNSMLQKVMDSKLYVDLKATEQINGRKTPII